MPNYSSGQGLNINKLVNQFKPNELSHAYVLAGIIFGKDIFAKYLIEVN